MNIIIVGCGQVGRTLATRLGGDGNNVTVVDKNGFNVRELVDKIDVMGVVGNGASHTTLLEAGIAEADLLIAVTDSDELNLLCCILAKKNSNCRTIARVRDREYSRESEYLKDELELAMIINPELATAEEIARVLRFPTAISIEPFAKRRVELIKFRLPKDNRIVGMTVRDVASKLKTEVLFCTVERDEETIIAKGDLVFCERDVISIIASHNKATDFFKKIGYKTQAVKNAIILGGSKVARYLCNKFKSHELSFKLIESDPAVCDMLSTEFPHVTVVRGDSSDRELLEEEGIESAEALLSLTDDDENNVLSSLYAGSVSAKKVVTKINRIDFDGVIRHLDLDTVVYPKNIVADTIVRYVRATVNTHGSNMETMYNLIPGVVEACEFVIREDCDLVGIPLSQLKLKSDVLIASILRGKSVIIPGGQDSIEVGDSVVVVAKATSLHDITDLLESGDK